MCLRVLLKLASVAGVTEHCTVHIHTTWCDVSTKFGLWRIVVDYFGSQLYPFKLGTVVCEGSAVEFIRQWRIEQQVAFGNPSGVSGGLVTTTSPTRHQQI
jgi:hypothetical protein